MPGEPLHQGSDAKHTLTYTLVEVPALLTRGCCCNTACGVRQHRELCWELTERQPADKAADGRARCTERLPGWEALLHEPVLTRPSSSLEGCQRHSGTELLAPSGLQAPHNRAFAAGKEKKRSFCYFSALSVLSQTYVLRLYRLTCVWES